MNMKVPQGIEMLQDGSIVALNVVCFSAMKRCDEPFICRKFLVLTKNNGTIDTLPQWYSDQEFKQLNSVDLKNLMQRGEVKSWMCYENMATGSGSNSVSEARAGVVAVGAPLAAYPNAPASVPAPLALAPVPGPVPGPASAQAQAQAPAYAQANAERLNVYKLLGKYSSLRRLPDRWCC